MAFYKIIGSDNAKILIDSPLGKITLTENSIKGICDKFDINLYDLVDGDINVTDILKDGKPCSKFMIKMVCSTLIDLPLGFTVHVGKFSELPNTKRFCYKQLWDFLNSGESNRVAMLYGTRRTGKTVLMQQAVNDLIQSGIPSQKIVFMTIQKNAIDGNVLCDYVRHLLSFGIEYLFIDELTYVEGNLNWTSILSDNTPSKMIVLAATDSLMFKELTRTVLFERTKIVKTTYVSYNEFATIYQGASLIDYMQSGGILRSASEYLERYNFNFEEYSQYGLDYAGSAIIENIIGCFNRFELEQRYPNLNKMTDDRLRTFLFKWMQRYSEQLILRMFNRKLKSADVGNLMDCVNKKYPIEQDTVYSDIGKHLTQFLINRLHVNAFNDYTQAELDEIFSLMKDLDCIVEVDAAVYLLPIALRYSYAYETIKVLTDEFNFLCTEYKIPFDLEEARTIIQNCVQGILLESVIFIDLKKLGYLPRKWHDNDTHAEIDLIMKDAAYEIKHNHKIELYQCRWLVHSKTLNSCMPQSLNLITLCKEEKDIVCTEYEVMQAVLEHKKEHGEPTSEIERYLTVADREIKHTIHCWNAEKFLKNQQPYIIN